MRTAICPFCGKKVDKFIMFRGDVVGCRFCGIHTKQTNADRIRAMTDEELAEWIYQVQDGDAYQKENYLPPLSKSWWLKWLKQEAKDES